MPNPAPDSMMARATILAIAFVVLPPVFGSSGFAQVTGKVIGKVATGETRQPLVGAQVIVEGTNLGNMTDEDGYYFINSVPVGRQRVRAQYLGYQTTLKERRVLAGQTVTVDFGLSNKIVEAAAIVAVIEREPLVARDNTISKTRFTAETAQSLPGEDLGEIIELGAGIYRFRGTRMVASIRPIRSGFVIRGGRTSESAVFVDGVLITDFVTNSDETEVGRFAVEEVDIITGGFNAEFGHAQSGVINIVTREGGREFHGNVRYTTDGQFGTNGYELDELGLAFDPETELFDIVGGPTEETCCGYNGLETSVGGPLIPGKLTFFGSLEAEGAADFFPRSSGWNPAETGLNSHGSTKTILPGNRGDRTRLQLKLTSFLPRRSKLTATYLYSRDQFENFGQKRGRFQFLNDAATRTKTNDIIVGWDQQLYPVAERSLNLQVRGNWHRTQFHRGTPWNEFSATFLANDPQFMANCGQFCDEVNAALSNKDTFAEDFLNYRFGDIDFFFENADPVQQELLTVPPRSTVNPDPVFGVPQLIPLSGLSPHFRSTDERRYGLRIDMDGQLNRVHRIKVGGEYTWINLANRGGRFRSGGFADLYDVDPRVAAFYAQDRMDYGDLVIDVGLRIDYWDPNAEFPLYPGVVACEISAFPEWCQDPAENPLAQVVDADGDVVLSPRLGVAHPITDNTQVRLSYGKFHQLPELRRYYDSYITDATATTINTLYGNPRLDYIETTAFEAGITNLLSENVVLDVVGFNRDRRGAIRVDVFQQNELADGVGERRIATNADNGNVKGVDITLSKRYSHYWSADVAWSLQWARGTTSSPVEYARSFGHLLDPLFPGRLLTPPTELSAETFDRLHTINVQFSLRFPDDYREGTTSGSIFNNWGLYLVYNAHSGEPFTWRATDGPGTAVGDLNSSRLPWFHQGDIRVTKGFALSDVLDLEVFASVINFLDIDNVVAVNVTSGRPDMTGFEDDLSQTPTIHRSFRTDDSGPTDFPVALADLKEEFRDEFACQDFDADGVIRLEEAQRAVRDAIQATGASASWLSPGDSPYHYGEPRQWRFGAELRF